VAARNNAWLLDRSVLGDTRHKTDFVAPCTRDFIAHEQRSIRAHLDAVALVDHGRVAPLCTKRRESDAALRNGAVITIADESINPS
jgi:hypothetical protein